MTTNQHIILKEYANGVNPTEKNFELQTCDIPTPQAGEVFLKTLYLSVDPYMRGCITGIESYYYPQFPLGQLIISNGVAQVIESKNSRFQPGDLVEGLMAWQNYSVSDGMGELNEGKGLRKVNPNIKKLSHAVGILGMPGMNAYFGTLEVAGSQKGETIIISVLLVQLALLLVKLLRYWAQESLVLLGHKKKFAGCKKNSDLT